MRDSDAKEFISIWTAANEVYNVQLTDAAVAMAFQVLRKFELNQISEAVGRYLADPENGRFQPKPADIVKQIEGELANDGRPSADEAWSIGVQSFDENNTVVMTQEISKALQHSGVIYTDGDKTGARMAFRASYEREVKTARERGDKVKWFPSLGLDPSGRRGVLEQAVNDGLLPAAQVNDLLPAPITERGQKLLAHAVSGAKSEDGLIHFEKLKAALEHSTDTDDAA